MYKNIIFDLGGVIEKINPQAVVREFKKIGLQDADSVFTLFRQSAVCLSFELGEMNKEDFIAYLQSMCSSNVSASLIERAWCANQLGISRETVETLDKLKEKKIRLLVLSNTNPIHMQKVRDVFLKTYAREFETLFDDIYCSFEIHSRKPDAEAYSYLLEHVRLEPTQCIYIDDLEINLQVPRKLGMYCIHHPTNVEVADISLLKEILHT